jgi:hypothetical protein
MNNQDFNPAVSVPNDSRAGATAPQSGSSSAVHKSSCEHGEAQEGTTKSTAGFRIHDEQRTPAAAGLLFQNIIIKDGKHEYHNRHN